MTKRGEIQQWKEPTLSKIIENPKRQTLRNNEYYDFQVVQDQLYADSQNGKIFTNLMSKIMDKNNVYDIDGSDNMADYLKVSASIDSIYKANKWVLLHLTSCSMGDLYAH